MVFNRHPWLVNNTQCWFISSNTICTKDCWGDCRRCVPNGNKTVSRSPWLLGYCCFSKSCAALIITSFSQASCCALWGPSKILRSLGRIRMPAPLLLIRTSVDSSAFCFLLARSSAAQAWLVVCAVCGSLHAFCCSTQLSSVTSFTFWVGVAGGRSGIEELVLERSSVVECERVDAGWGVSLPLFSCCLKTQLQSYVSFLFSC